MTHDINETPNPYRAPDFPQTAGVPLPHEVIPASKGARFANFVIDYFVPYGIAAALGVAIMMIAGDAGIDFIERMPGIAFSIPILFIYYFTAEATTSRTLGKLVTGTKVVNEDGGRPSAGQIAGRTFARLIPFEAFSFLGTTARGWHDSLPNTYVIKIR